MSDYDDWNRVKKYPRDKKYKKVKYYLNKIKAKHLSKFKLKRINDEDEIVSTYDCLCQNDKKPPDDNQSELEKFKFECIKISQSQQDKNKKSLRMGKRKNKNNNLYYGNNMTKKSVINFFCNNFSFSVLFVSAIIRL